MPRRAPNLVRWSPSKQTYEVDSANDSAFQVPQADSDGWLAWLQGIVSFSFHARSGSYCTVRKEKLQRGGDYWYAYRSANGRTAKRYIGRSADLSIARLEDIAERLAGLSSDKEASDPAPERDAMTIPAVAESYAAALPSSAPSISRPLHHVMPLLASKLHPPRLHGGLVERTQLLDRLDAGLASKLTILSAPAGFGKTTLVRQWIADRTTPAGLPVAWVALDGGDNDPVRFWRYAITACQALGTGIGQPALSELSAAVQPPFEPPSLEAVLALALNDLTQHAHGGLLILEDYHAITASRIHETLTFFIDHLPPMMHVVMLSRNEPPLPLVRWRARGDLHELQAGDLRFSATETAIFLHQMLPFTLSEKTIAQLDERLEGWAAGLRLLALSMQGPLASREVDQHVAILNNAHDPIEPHHAIVDYFVSEVLQLQPESLQNFLLRTSVLSRLTGPLCDVLTGRHDSAELLDAMERAGLFLESLDDGGHWYRYHALFAEAMRTVARQSLGEETLRTLSLQASHWYEQREMPTEAVDAALHARDTERATVLIERLTALGHFQFHELHTLRRWLEQMPDQVQAAHPDLCLTYGIALCFTQYPDAPTPALLTRIDEVLQMADDGWQRIGDRSRRGQVYAFRAMLAWRDGRIEDAARDARQALAWLPDDEDGAAGVSGPGVRGVLEWRAISMTVIATDAMYTGRVEEARQLFQEAQQRSAAAGNRPFVRIATMLLGAACVAMGELHQAEAYYQQVLPEARSQKDQDDVVFSLLSTIDLAYEWNDLDAAERMLDDICSVGTLTDFPEIDELGAFWQARLQHARGRMAAASQQITGIVARLQARASPRALQIVASALIWQGRFHLMAGDLFTAQRSLDVLCGLSDRIPPVQGLQAQVLAARILVARGQAHDALSLLEGLLVTAQDWQQVRLALEIQVLMSLALVACKQAHEARLRLRLVLSQACTEGYIRQFVDEGEPLAALLRSLMPSLQGPALRSYARTILQASASSGQASRGAPAAVPGIVPVEPLSAQEQRILRLVAAGRSNAEIARELVISVNTVKGHVKSLYRKLNVANRLEASEAARRLAPVGPLTSHEATH